MSYRYIAVASPIGTRISDIAPTIEATLLDAGMVACFNSGSFTLFVSKETPILPLPGGGVVVGHLFTQEGSWIRDQLPPAGSSHVPLRKKILESYWGAYLLVEKDSLRDGGMVVTRDPSSSGEIRCLYSVKGEISFLTSDISLAAHLGLYRRSVDWDFIASRLAYPGVKMQRTGLADIRELLPGCSLRLHGTDTSIEQVWSPWNFVASDRRHRNLHEAAAEVRSAVAKVTHAWASTDTSILLELSGGLDSSIVAACLRNASARVTCCNLVTPAPGADERAYANVVAKRLGVELHAEELSYESACFEFEPPPDSASPGMGPLQRAINGTMEAAANRHGATSFISGGGGDTVFCYLRTAAPAADALCERGFLAGNSAVRDLAELHQCTLWKAGRLALSKLLKAPKSPYDMDASFIPSNALIGTPEAHPWFVAPVCALPGDRERIFDLAGNQMFPDQLPRGTRHRLHMPLLSQPVMEACLKTPSWMWISGGLNRAVARIAFKDLLPMEVLNRRSKGTFMNYLGALYQRHRNAISQFLLTGQLQERGLLETVSLKQFLGNDAPPRDQAFLRIFYLAMIENWVRYQR